MPRRVLTTALLGLMLSTLLVAAPPRPAGACESPGGATLPFTPQLDLPDDLALVLNGGGWGHGVGMSQYGAQGGALLGCDHATILGTYYVGTQLETLPSQRSTVAVHLRTTSAGGTTFTVNGNVPWRACDLSGTNCPTVATQPAGSTWRATGIVDGTFVLHDPGTDPGRCVVGRTSAGCHWRGGDGETRLRLWHDGTVVRVDDLGRRFRWGWTELDWTTRGGTRTIVNQYVNGGGGVGSLDRYLRGLAEVPASWHREALRSQAVAGRSYAEATIRGREAVYGRHPTGGYMNRDDCRCDLFATTVDQVYRGWDHEDAEPGTWRQAVDDTAGRVLTHDGKPIAAFYSSSHGGSSDAVRDVWGADLPYLPSVDTSRWEQAAGNRRQRWTRTFTQAEAARSFGLSRFDSLTLEQVGRGGRAVRANGGGAVVRGLDSSGRAVERRYSGEQLRSRLALWSANVRVWGDGSPPTSPSPTEPAEVAFDRVSGPNRVRTGIAVSQVGWDRSDVVVLARGDDPADALAGSALAGKHAAPLLVTGSDVLDADVAKELQRLGTKRVLLLGGTAALSTLVEQAITGLGMTADRVAGRNRFETAVEVSRRLDVAADGVVLMVRGDAWPDALAVAGLAAARARDGQPRPVLLAGDGLPPATAERVRELRPSAIAMIGGSAVLPAGVEDGLTGLGIGLERGDLVRYSGADRWGTSRALAALDIGDEEVLVVAQGQTSFVDGLFAGPLTAKLGGRMLLVPPSYRAGSNPFGSGQHLDLVDDLGWSDGRLVVVGGRGVVPDAVGSALHQAMR